MLNIRILVFSVSVHVPLRYTDPSVSSVRFLVLPDGPCGPRPLRPSPEGSSGVSLTPGTKV